MRKVKGSKAEIEFLTIDSIDKYTGLETVPSKHDLSLRIATTLVWNEKRVCTKQRKDRKDIYCGVCVLECVRGTLVVAKSANAMVC